MIDLTQTIAVLTEAKEALLNMNAGRCYNSGHTPCQCTPCKIDREIEIVKAEIDEDETSDDDEEFEFQCCDECDLHDACTDFGCAIRNGIVPKPII